MRIYNKKFLLLSVAVISLSSCKTATLSGRFDIADDIGARAGLQKQSIDAAPFRITTYRKMNNTGGSANIYIEGDGLAWLSKTQPSLNPTPTDPFALRLAAQDNSGNVVYMARPCQYSGRIDGELCNSKYWRSARYAPEVIQSYSLALDTIKTQYKIDEFNLIGYSGGGTLAALLAAERNDIATLRSIAGNLDHEEHSRTHKVSYLAGSLNPPDFAAKLSSIPQYHFIGGDDKIVPANIYHSYASTFNDPRCLNYKIMQGKDHVSQSWQNDWANLMSHKPHCR